MQCLAIGSPCEGNGEVITDKQADFDCYDCILTGLGRPKDSNQSFEIVRPAKMLEAAYEHPDFGMLGMSLDLWVQVVSKIVLDTQNAGRAKRAKSSPNRYREKWDDWIAARYDSFAGASGGLRIPMARLVREFDERYPDPQRPKRSLENHIQRTDRLRRKRIQYPRSRKGRSWNELRRT